MDQINLYTINSALKWFTSYCISVLKLLKCYFKLKHIWEFLSLQLTTWKHIHKLILQSLLNVSAGIKSALLHLYLQISWLKSHVSVNQPKRHNGRYLIKRYPCRGLYNPKKKTWQVSLNFHYTKHPDLYPYCQTHQCSERIIMRFRWNTDWQLIIKVWL